jgi:hypothetical protein
VRSSDSWIQPIIVEAASANRRIEARVRRRGGTADWDDDSELRVRTIQSFGIYLRQNWFKAALDGVLLTVIAFWIWPDAGVQVPLWTIGLGITWSLGAMPFALIAAAAVWFLLMIGWWMGFVTDDD